MFEVDVKNVTEEGRRGGKKGRGPGSVFLLGLPLHWNVNFGIKCKYVLVLCFLVYII